MSQSDYNERVHELPCVICLKKLGRKQYGVHAHHAGDASDRNDFVLVPLCPEHHEGLTGVHGMHRRGFHRYWKTTDMQLIGWTNELLHK